MKNKKLWITVGVVILIVAIIIGIRIYQPEKEEDVIKIGAILPLTGSAVEIAEQHKKGLDFGLELINSKNKIHNKKLKIIYEDDGNDPKKTVAAFNKLIDIHKVPLVITVMSSPSMAVYPISDARKIVLFANCGHPDITQLSDWVFRNFPTSKQEAELMVDFAYNYLKIKNLAILYINDAFGESAMKTIKQKFEKLGGKIKIIESFEKDGVDFKSIVEKVIGKNPSAIYLYGYGKSNGFMLKQLKERGYNKYILGSYNFSIEPTLSIAGPALEGTFFTSPIFNPFSTDPIIKDFVSSFEKKYGIKPQWNTVNEYDAINLIAYAIKNTKSYDGISIKEQLKRINEFQGIGGNYIFKNNEWITPLIIKTFKNGKIEIVN